MSGADRVGAPGGVEMGTATMVVNAMAETEVGSSPAISDTRCYVAARIERERAEGEAEAGATVPAGVLFTRGREGRDGWLPGEASNLIVASCLIITDTGFSFIEMTDLTPKETS